MMIVKGKSPCSIHNALNVCNLGSGASVHTAIQWNPSIVATIGE